MICSASLQADGRPLPLTRTCRKRFIAPSAIAFGRTCGARRYPRALCRSRPPGDHMARRRWSEARRRIWRRFFHRHPEHDSLTGPWVTILPPSCARLAIVWRSGRNPKKPLAQAQLIRVQVPRSEASVVETTRVVEPGADAQAIEAAISHTIVPAEQIIADGSVVTESDGLGLAMLEPVVRGVSAKTEIVGINGGERAGAEIRVREIQATDIQATDIQATEIQATEIQVTDLQSGASKPPASPLTRCRPRFLARLKIRGVPHRQRTQNPRARKINSLRCGVPAVRRSDEDLVVIDARVSATRPPPKVRPKPPDPWRPRARPPPVTQRHRRTPRYRRLTRRTCARAAAAGLISAISRKENDRNAPSVRKAPRALRRRARRSLPAPNAGVAGRRIGHRELGARQTSDATRNLIPIRPSPSLRL